MRVGVVSSEGEFSVYDAVAVEYADGQLTVRIPGSSRDIVVAEMDDGDAKKVLEALVSKGAVLIKLNGYKVEVV